MDTHLSIALDCSTNACRTKTQTRSDNFFTVLHSDHIQYYIIDDKKPNFPTPGAVASLGYLFSFAWLSLHSSWSPWLSWIGCCATACVYKAARYVRRLRSRGDLVKDFVASPRPHREGSARAYAQMVAANRCQYGGFNLLVGGMADEWWYVSNTGGVTENHCVPLKPGIHVLANGSLFAKWEKQTRGAALFRRAIEEDEDPGQDPTEQLILRLHTMLRDDTRSPSHLLPQTGAPLLHPPLTLLLILLCNTSYHLPQHGDPPSTGYAPSYEHAWSAIASAPLEFDGQVHRDMQTNTRAHAHTHPFRHTHTHTHARTHTYARTHTHT